MNNSDWNGITFPGGHVENAEGLILSTVREVKKERGLDIDELIFCGPINSKNR
ncbi:MAG: NUDIX domain-containing protein [Clostridiales bacterium]|nr:NUDIX domain-containing protein [Clostridiales bacterium]